MKPLAGKRILITRPPDRPPAWCAWCRSRREPVSVPAIEILPVADPLPFHALSQRLDSFDLAIFVSRNAVRSALALLGSKPGPRI
jgi:uroporphyrinogen-III synthase